MNDDLWAPPSRAPTTLPMSDDMADDMSQLPAPTAATTRAPTTQVPTQIPTQVPTPVTTKVPSSSPTKTTTDWIYVNNKHSNSLKYVSGVARDKCIHAYDPANLQTFSHAYKVSCASGEFKSLPCVYY